MIVIMISPMVRKEMTCCKCSANPFPTSCSSPRTANKEDSVLKSQIDHGDYRDDGDGDDDDYDYDDGDDDDDYDDDISPVARLASRL